MLPENTTPVDPIRFMDPKTGETYDVKPEKHTVAAAWKLGFMPRDLDDFDRAEAVDNA